MKRTDDQSNKGLIKSASAQHATADEWMENEDRIKEQKKREAEERAMLREANRAKKVQEKEAKKQCSAVFRSGRAAVYSHVPIPVTEGQFFL